ncbi:unnamed protein product [Paramecium octaurelia]|uniref:Uncharacterized protein n=1 Tax=Paramecium octaurelia TaxID=43137 RepID=A0A8S1VW44_PAROT|nr:unnamed protein product [Paramecium octaurelia]
MNRCYLLLKLNQFQFNERRSQFQRNEIYNCWEEVQKVFKLSSHLQKKTKHLILSTIRISTFMQKQVSVYRNGIFFHLISSNYLEQSRIIQILKLEVRNLLVRVFLQFQQTSKCYNFMINNNPHFEHFQEFLNDYSFLYQKREFAQSNNFIKNSSSKTIKPRQEETTRLMNMNNNITTFVLRICLQHFFN